MVLLYVNLLNFCSIFACKWVLQYNLYTKILGRRLREVTKNLVLEEQTGFATSSVFVLRQVTEKKKSV
jgi:hypothetical protein